MESPVIVLESTHLIGEGRIRWCYRHPQDPGKCIKIDKPNKGGATEKEVFYYRKLRWFRSSLSCTHVPRFHGTVEPNMGCGGVSDLIRDETTGEISGLLSSYIISGEVTADAPRWAEACRSYVKTLLEAAVVIDFHAAHICVRRLRDGSLRFVTVDGIGHREFIPVRDFFKMVGAQQDPAALQMEEVRFARGNSREPQEQEGQSLGFKGMWNKPVSCP